MAERKFQIGMIRVLTVDNEKDLNLHGDILMKRFPQLEIESRCIPDQWEGIYNDETEAKAIPKILELAKGFQDKDMILVSCADDPGVAEIREAFPEVPVTGGGETAAALATRFGNKIAVLGIMEQPPKAYRRMIPDKILVSGRPEGVRTTLDLQTPEGKANAVKKALEFKAQGAEVIALGCTGFASIGIAKLLEEKTGLPVIDGLLAQGIFAVFEMERRA